MDIEYLLFLQELRGIMPHLVGHIFMLVSDLANGPALVLVPCVVYWCLNRRRGLAVLMAFTLGSLINQVVKITVCCARPWMRDARVVPFEGAIESATGYSFPSGHTQSAASVVEGIGWEYRNDRSWILPACCAIVLTVGFSRNLLGVHTPQDVLVALAIGILSIAASECVLRWTEASGRHRDVFSVVLVLASGVMACYALLKGYPTTGPASGVDLIETMDDSMQTVGLMAGAGLGYWCAGRWAQFDPAEGLRGAIMRICIGAVVVLVMRYGVAKIVAFVIPALAGLLVKEFLTTLAVVFLAPAAFMWVEGKLSSSAR